jgi:excisionase family DNA binding protein
VPTTYCWCGGGRAESLPEARNAALLAPRDDVAFLVFVGDACAVTNDDDQLLTTGEAAALLGSSRQHVVDLCTRGLLPFMRAGTHRRLRRADVEAMLRPALTRDQLRSLWLHRAVAGQLVEAPNTVMAKAEENLQRLRQVHPTGMAAVWLGHWRTTLDGVLPDAHRLAVLAAFASYWRGEHAA